MDPDQRIWTAGLVVIGDEILSGRTQDRNIGTIAGYLTAAGIDLREVRAHQPDALRVSSATRASAAAKSSG